VVIDSFAIAGAAQPGLRADVLGDVVYVTVNAHPELMEGGDPALEAIAREVAPHLGEHRLGEIRQALMVAPERAREIADALLWMERNIWSKLPPGVRGVRITRGEREEIMGYGPDGY
jgi:antitoxin VapB